jgi:putative phosphoesterase
MDREPWAAQLPATAYVEAGGKRLYVLHDLGQLDIEPRAAGVDIVVYGHSHQPSLEYRDDVLYLNPGSAGPRRFSLPVSMACLCVSGSSIAPELISLLPSDETRK